MRCAADEELEGGDDGGVGSGVCVVLVVVYECEATKGCDLDRLVRDVSFRRKEWLPEEARRPDGTP